MPKVENAADGRFASRIRELRGDRSLREIATSAGIAHSYLHRIERGEVKLPSPPTVKALADALGTDYIDLLAVAGYL